jgi:hypothetical protein
MEKLVVALDVLPQLRRRLADHRLRNEGLIAPNGVGRSAAWLRLTEELRRAEVTPRPPHWMVSPTKGWIMIDELTHLAGRVWLFAVAEGER